MDSINLGRRISECRQNIGMTQEELAGRIGVTPQALSKWERNQSVPDVLLLVDLCHILKCSLDYLLGTQSHNLTENNDEKSQNEIWKNLRNCLEPLELTFGKDLVPAFMDDSYIKQIVQVRKNLSKEGILMPLVRVRDDMELAPAEFAISSFGKRLYGKTIEKSDAVCESIMKHLEHTVRNQYAEIINRDLIKEMVDNLKEKYPVLISETIPSKISYGFLTDIIKHFLKKNGHKRNSLQYLPKIIEIVDDTLREKGQLSTEEFATVLLDELP